MAQPSVHQLYKRLETIGKGAYGSVSKGVHIPSGNFVALKIINLDTADDDVDDIQREVALLTQLRDAPNITKYYGCYMDGPRVWIVMELAQGGSVLSLMKASRDGCLEEKFISVIIREVLVGLSYLHKVPVIHRDMKAANILVTAVGKVMICDFGVSALLATASSKRNTLTGTPYWMAPEVVQAVPAYDTKADIWSLGIMIYEMAKGTPPHSNLDKFKVMDLIPRAKPPRLTDSEAGKDMRDFMSFCLKEAPIERLPADELLKTKWVKSTAKVPVSILQELVRRLQQAGPRDSMAGPLDWEVEELGTDNESIWEFETVRGRPHAPFQDDTNSYYDGLDTEPVNAQATIRPGPSAPLPSSLRLLFQHESTQQNTFRASTFQQPFTRSLPIEPSPPPPPQPQPPLSTPPFASAQTKRPLPLDMHEDDLAKTGEFVFPRPTRSKLNLSSVANSEEDSISPSSPSSTESYNNGNLDDISPETKKIEGSSSTVLGTVRSTATYRDIRSTRGPPDISIPSTFDKMPELPTHTIPVNSASPSGLSSSSPDISTASTTRPLIPRKRSQSTAEGLAGRKESLTPHSDSNHHHPNPSPNPSPNPNLASSTGFQFPANPTKPAAPFGSVRAGDGLASSTSAKPQPAPPAMTSPGSHQTTYSLDTSSSTRRNASASATTRSSPSMMRTRSATALPEVQSPPSTAFAAIPSSSLHHPEVFTDGLPLLPPVRPFAEPMRRNRSGSDSSSTSRTVNLGTPGLKDVLKIPSLSSEHQLGLSDLLPPSPSAVVNNRIYNPSPSHLNSSTTINPFTAPLNHPNFKDTGSPFSLGLPRTSSPPSFDLRSAPVDMTSSMYPSSRVHGHNPSSSLASISSLPGSNVMPVLRPLDYSSLVTIESTQTELARTIDDLSKCLSVVEIGFTSMLDTVYADTIEEEQEDTADPIITDSETEQEQDSYFSLYNIKPITFNA
ncbi:Pkinase-domain-containing protein [Lentinula lateritia]|nr:Pkinase-domain-containing protein [Lentinula lateritia]